MSEFTDRSAFVNFQNLVRRRRYRVADSCCAAPPRRGRWCPLVGRQQTASGPCRHRHSERQSLSPLGGSRVGCVGSSREATAHTHGGMHMSHDAHRHAHSARRHARSAHRHAHNAHRHARNAHRHAHSARRHAHNTEKCTQSHRHAHNTDMHTAHTDMHTAQADMHITHTDMHTCIAFSTGFC